MKAEELLELAERYEEARKERKRANVDRQMIDEDLYYLNKAWDEEGAPVHVIPHLRELLALRKSQRTAELRAMRVLVDALELRMKQTLEAGSAPGTASILDAFLDGLDSDAQLASLLEEADNASVD